MFCTKFSVVLQMMSVWIFLHTIDWFQWMINMKNKNIFFIFLITIKIKGEQEASKNTASCQLKTVSYFA